MPILGRLSGQAVFALLLLVLTTVYASQIFELGLPFSSGTEPGASFLPIILSIVMYVCLLRILVGELRGCRAFREPETPSRSEHVPRVSVTGPVLLILATVFFAATLRILGYFLAAGLYTFMIAAWFNYEQTGRPVRAAALALVSAAGITAFGWLFFVQVFGLSLPTLRL